MHFFAILSNLRLQDGLDILFLTVVAYHLYLWFQGTKAFKALVGLFVLGIIFTVSRSWGLFLTTWVFQIFWQVLVILLIILFQSEIRQVLERVNPLKAIGLHRRSLPEKWVRVFSEAAFSLAAHKIGAMMIIERADRVDELITGGHPLEGEPSRELMTSIFQRKSPLHDGALLIRDGQIVMVACYLPLSAAEGLPKEWGTRHRAAIGLTERCDALVVVISEERGGVSLARTGELRHMEEAGELNRYVLEAIAPISPSKSSFWRRARSLLLDRWPVKAGTLALVSVVWLLLAGQQDVEVSLRVPLEIKNIPSQIRIIEPVNPEVRIKVRGLRKDASMLSGKNLRAEIDLSAAGAGRRDFPITRDHIWLPNDRVQVVDIVPATMGF